MLDYNGYLPHHRDSRMDDLDLKGRSGNPIAWLELMVIACLLGVGFVQGIVRHQEIEDAKAKAALQERQRIVEAVARDLEDQRRYAAYLNNVVAREYRSIRQAGL